MVAKVDVAEALATWHLQSSLILGLILAMMVLAVVAVFAAWQRNAKAHYREMLQAETARRRAEERYRVTLMSAGDGIIVADVEGRLELMNSVAEALTGWTKEEARGQLLEKVFCIVNETTRMPVENPIRRVIHEGVIVGLANHTVLIARDGVDRPIADSGAPIRNADGVIIGAVLVFRDQTEQRQAENALRESEQQFRNLVELLPQTVYERDLDGRLTFVNQHGLEILGYTEADLEAGLNCFQVVASQDHDRVRQNMQRLLDGQHIRGIEYTVQRKDGSQFPAIIHSSLIHRGDATIGLRGIIVDISGFKRAERAIVASEIRYRRLFETAKDGILLLNADTGMVIDANPFLVELLGFSHAAFLGKAIWELGVFKDIVANHAKFSELQQKGYVRYEHLPLKTADGRSIDVEFVSNVYQVNDGKIIQCNIRDITERKLVESEREITIEVLRLLGESKDRHALLRSVTALLHEWSGCEAVGIRLREGEDFPYYETRGFPPEFVLAENRLCAADSQGELTRDSKGDPILECMCGNVLCGRFDPAKPFFTAHGSFWTNCTTELLANTTEADRQSRTRNRCNGEGYESVALIPLRAAGETFGLLQLNDRHRGRFTPRGISLLERLADSVALGLAHRNAQESLRESASRLEMVAQAGNVGLWDWDLRTNSVYLSPHWKRQIGYEDHEIGNDLSEWQSRVHPDDLDRCLKTVRTFIEKPWPDYDLEFRFRHKDGTYRWILAQASLVRDDQGEAVRMLGSHIDITERKRVEQNYRTLFREMLNGFALHEIICDEAGVPVDYRFLAVNPAFERMTGLKAKDIVGRTVLETLPTTELHWIETYGKVALTGEPVFFEHYHALLNKYFEVSAFQPVVNQFACIFADVTQRMQAVAEAREAKEFSDHVISHAGDGIIVYDRDSRYVVWNRFMEDLTGIPADQVLGRNCFDLFPHLRQYGIDRLLERAFAGETVFATEVPYDLPQTQRAGWIAATYGPQRDAKGVVIGAIAIIRDVTERKRAEESIRRLERMQSEAEKLAATGRMAARIAHEINNPLAGIKNSFRLIRDAVPADHPDRDMVERIDREIARISGIVQQMYTLYSPKAGHMTDVIVGDAIRDVLSMLEPLRREYQVEFDATHVLSGLRVRVPEGGLHQVVYNLTSNAAEASPNGGVITISVELDAGYPDLVKISVHDCGEGIPPDIQLRIFEPFFTSRTDDNSRGGLGLGLSVVKSVVEATGGRIEFESAPEKGTTFRVFLPHIAKAKEQ